MQRADYQRETATYSAYNNSMEHSVMACVGECWCGPKKVEGLDVSGVSKILSVFSFRHLENNTMQCASALRQYHAVSSAPIRVRRLCAARQLVADASCLQRTSLMLRTHMLRRKSVITKWHFRNRGLRHRCGSLPF